MMIALFLAERVWRTRRGALGAALGTLALVALARETVGVRVARVTVRVATGAGSERYCTDGTAGVAVPASAVAPTGAVTLLATGAAGCAAFAEEPK
jgi:hypothetical protein